MFQLVKKHRNGHVTKVDWLDRLTFREIGMINEKEKRKSDYMYVMVEFPVVEFEGMPVSFLQNVRLSYVLQLHISKSPESL